MCAHVPMCATMQAWRSEKNLEKSILSFHYTNFDDWTQIIGLGDKCLYLLGYLTALLLVLNINFSNISNGPQVSLESELSRSMLFSVAVLGFVFIFASLVP